MKIEARKNWSGMGKEGDDECLESSGDIGSSKRRKQTGSSSEIKNQEDPIGCAEAAGKLAKQTIKEPFDHLPASTNVSAAFSPRRWRKFILTCMFQSLSDDEGGMQQCILDALTMTVKGSDSPDEDGHEFSIQRRWTHSGSQYAAKTHIAHMPYGSLDESHHYSVAEICQRAFLRIMLSEKFTSLCKLLCENFRGMNVDNLLGLNLINNRMKEGAYEHSPTLFTADIQKLWTNLERIGTEFISLAKGLSDVTKTCCKEQFDTQESKPHGKSKCMEAYAALEGCTCRTCGKKEDGRDYLVCDSCEEMYHLSCVEPAIKEMPPTFWLCAACLSCGTGSQHGHCVVCEGLYGSERELNQAGQKVSSTSEETFHESKEASTYGMDSGPEQVQQTKDESVCKICAAPVKEGEELRICHDAFCSSKYYHVRCLSTRQSKSYGPHWYCPSCLCRICLTDIDDDKVILCDGCDRGYHLYCLSPPLFSVPEGKWFCRQCNVKIREIHRAKCFHENQTNTMQGQRDASQSKLKNSDVGEKDEGYSEEKQNTRYEEQSDKGPEGMDILLGAVLTLEEEAAGDQPKG